MSEQGGSEDVETERTRSEVTTLYALVPFPLGQQAVILGPGRYLFNPLPHLFMQLTKRGEKGKKRALTKSSADVDKTLDRVYLCCECVRQCSADCVGR